MSANTLNSVAIDVVGQYNLAGKYLVNAYVAGAQRLATQIGERYVAIIKSPSLPVVDTSVRNSLVAAHEQFAGLVFAGVTRAAQQAELAIDRISDSTAQGIKSLGSVGQRVEAVVGAPVVDTLTKLNMPAAKLSLQIAGSVAEGTKRLADRVAAVEEIVAAQDVKAPAKSSAKRKA